MNPETDTPPDIDADAALDLVIKMMAIPGKSCEEAAIAEFIVNKLRRAGLPETAVSFDGVTRISPAGGGTGNLIVKFPGTYRAPRRMLMAHIDTVPLCVGCKPTVEGNVVKSSDPTTALGADNRGGAAVLLNSALQILEKGLPHPPLTFFWPVQEEIGLYGARYVTLSKLGNPKLCFNWDGSMPYVACVGATGDYSVTIEIDGIASHAGSRPEQGVNAIIVASLALADLQQNGWHGLVIKGRNRGSSNLGVIAGGDATNVVTPFVKLRGEVRSHNPAFRERMVKEFRKAFERAVKQVKTVDGRKGTLRFQADLKYEAFRLSDDEPCVVEALRVINSLGLPGETRVSNGGLDANWLSSHGFPTVTLGCGQQDVHTVKETLNIPDFLNAARIGLLLATGQAAS